MNEAEHLIQQAFAIRRRAYAPYSGFAVGAALLDDQGQVHGGCNVENASYGLTICAERAAVASAVAAGVRSFRALAIVSTGAVPPCGACRQVLSEFVDSLPIWLADADVADRIFETTLAALFPSPFRAS